MLCMLADVQSSDGEAAWLIFAVHMCCKEEHVPAAGHRAGRAGDS